MPNGAKLNLKEFFIYLGLIFFAIIFLTFAFSKNPAVENKILDLPLESSPSAVISPSD
jgi:hypothetical protein